MKTVTILRFLTFLGSALTTIAALDLTGIANLLDEEKAQYLLITGPASLALKELVVVLGDLFDDGKPNKSFKVGLWCAAMACLCVPILSSCSALPASALPASAEVITKDGSLIMQPDGRVIITVEPRNTK